MFVIKVVQQHVDDAASLAEARQLLTRAAYPTLSRLHRADRRLAAHLNGLRITADGAQLPLKFALERPSLGVVFAFAVDVVESKDVSRIEQLLALAEAVPEACNGLLCAFGWLDGSFLKGIVLQMLNHADGFRSTAGLAACAMHRVDPTTFRDRLLRAVNPGTRARAFRTLGELGVSGGLSSCIDTVRNDPEPEVRFWGAWSAVLLGDRQIALDVLTQCGLGDGAHRVRAFRLSLQAMSNDVAHSTLRQLAGRPEHRRSAIEGCGIHGHPEYVAWLIHQMRDVQDARLAGEAFSLITGADLSHQALDCPAPDGFRSGPTDDADDPNVEMDPDDGLPWPNVNKIERWWNAQGGRFQIGRRYFLGQTVTKEHCIKVLKTGYQRQRVLAAHYLRLLEPGTPLFNTSAPAWRQQRLLAGM